MFVAGGVTIKLGSVGKLLVALLASIRGELQSFCVEIDGIVDFVENIGVCSRLNGITGNLELTLHLN